MQLKQTLASRFRRWVSPTIYLYSQPTRMCEYNALLRALAPGPGDTILDLGCGRGQPTLCFAKHAKSVVGLDVDEDAIRRAREDAAALTRALPVEFVCSTLQAARFPDGHFDKIVSVSVIEHIPELGEVLAECRRILKDGGVFALTTDQMTALRDPARQEHHRIEHRIVNHFTADSLRSSLETAGFRNVTIRSLLRSDYAKRVFADAIENDFRFGRVEAVRKYLRLAIADAWVPDRGNGLCLLARCVK
jgi:ubiquinone/menaquinone biosynthesis C-methylase UbiE